MDTLLTYGDALKIRARTDESITVDGYLIRFTSEDDPDLHGHYFTKSTRFDIEDEEKRFAYYHHGLDRSVKTKVMGRGVLRLDDVGVRAETEIQIVDDTTREIAAKAEAGKLFYSSGAVSHLVEIEKGQKADWIKTWPIGEISLTPDPAEPRNRVTRIKTLDTPTTTPDTVPTPTPMENTAQVQPDFAAEMASIKSMLANLQAPAPVNPNLGAPVQAVAPTIVKARGDSPEKALASWIKTKGADVGGVRGFLLGETEVDVTRMFKSSENSRMDIANTGAGAATVPIGHYNNIIARRNEMALWASLGCTNIPGKGTTVNVPVENDVADPWVLTNEAAAYDRDRPVISTVAMTLLKYTKRIELTEELMEDEDSRLMPFIENYVARGLAKTENALLIAEAQAGGTLLNSFAATSIAAGLLEVGIRAGNIAYYLDAGNPGFIMRPATHSALLNIVLNGERAYSPTNLGSGAQIRPSVLGYPVYWSHEVPGIAANNRSVYFGNFAYVGRREGELSYMFDPYSLSSTGETRLLYRTRLVYKVLQAEAIGFFRHASA